jgi:hypothetical protein
MATASLGIERTARPWDLYIARVLTLGPVALAFPVATAAVFGFGADRDRTADLLAIVYSSGLFLGFTTSFWPLSSLRDWTRFDRIESLCIVFLCVSYFTHLSWELVWLLFHDSIALSRDAAWAYPWWAYIDGGDLRYAEAPANLVMMEILSVTNGIVGVTGLALWFRSGRTDARGLLLCMATAVVHLYSTSLYYGGEILEGLPNVDTTSFLDTWVKFGLANLSWLVFPWFVLYWGWRHLQRQLARPGAAGSFDRRSRS